MSLFNNIFLALPGGKGMVKYVCEKCKKEFFSKDVYEKHMLEHKFEEASAGAYICPDCNGKGEYYGTDGTDLRWCTTCRGKGFVRIVPY